MEPTSEHIYTTALGFLGKDASPRDEAPDELACAESVSDVLIAAGCKMPVTLSTTQLDDFFKASALWEKTIMPVRGNILVSPTGTGGKNGIVHGHTAIVMDDGKLASNVSGGPDKGNLELHYDLKTWEEYYVVKGGYPMNFYALRALESPPEPTEPEKIAIASEAVSVATQAAQYPSLRPALPSFLEAILRFLGLTK